ncbi:metallophosphoesterase family protein [Variovorax gossypii]
MKVLVLSDLHLEFAPFEPAPDLEFDLVILAGDIHSPAAAALDWAADRFRGKPIVAIAGNHEYFRSEMDQELEKMRSRAKELGIHFLDCDEVVIAGVRFFGCTLWTDFRLRSTPLASRGSRCASCPIASAP